MDFKNRVFDDIPNILPSINSNNLPLGALMFAITLCRRGSPSNGVATKLINS